MTAPALVTYQLRTDAAAFTTDNWAAPEFASSNGRTMSVSPPELVDVAALNELPSPADTVTAPAVTVNPFRIVTAPASEMSRLSALLALFRRLRVAVPPTICGLAPLN